MTDTNFVITIGRQLASGGADVGKALAEYFGFRYIDKEILVKAADVMNVSVGNLKLADEKNTSVWSVLAQTAICEVPYMAEEWYIPTSKQLFEIQSGIMKKAVEEGPCVIIGRCAPYLFREYKKHVSIFLHADMDIRAARLEKRLGDALKGKDVRKYIEKRDRERAKYYNTFTGRKWLDLREYDLTLDTTPYSEDEVARILCRYIKARFPELG